MAGLRFAARASVVEINNSDAALRLAATAVAQRDDLLATMIGCKALIELHGDTHGIARTMQAAIDRIVGKEPPPAAAEKRPALLREQAW